MLLAVALASTLAQGIALGGTWRIAGNQTGSSAPLPLLTPAALRCSDDGAAAVSCSVEWADDSGAVLFAGSRWSVGVSTQTTSRVWAPNVYLGLQWVIGANTTARIVKPRTSSNLVIDVTQSLAAVQRTLKTTIRMSFFSSSDDTIVVAWSCSLPHLDLRVEYTRQAAGGSPAPRFSATTSRALTRAMRKRPQPRASAGADAAAPGAADVTEQAAPHAAPGAVTFELALCTSATADLLSDACFQRNAFAIALQGLLNRRDGARASSATRLTDDDARRSDASAAPPALYLVYPATWPYGYTPAVRDFFASEHNVSFANLDSTNVTAAPLADTAFGRALAPGGGALAALVKSRVKGYVKWDERTRESLVVAFTAAGVDDALVVTNGETEEFARDVLGLPLLHDLSTSLRGETPAAIYAWAKTQWWHGASRDYITWMGGECGSGVAPAMQPAIADFGVATRSFFVDLNTTVPGAGDDAAEYTLAMALIGELDPTHSAAVPPTVLGWHSYCKDQEHTFTSVASKHGARVHGLNSSPNLSFSNRIALPAGYVFRNRHSTPASKAAPSAARAAGATEIASSDAGVYLVLVQTDGLGLGAWARPGRGALRLGSAAYLQVAARHTSQRARLIAPAPPLHAPPFPLGNVTYAWEVTLPDFELQPALLQMFYEQATERDFFVGALSGPGYMYPKVVPPALLPKRLQYAQSMMTQLDLAHWIVFDASAAVRTRSSGSGLPARAP